ncbi:Rieske 2Fe-2S domain-containing protein [Pseudomonas sp. NEEL19]|uniref:Rieske (2Fe-2S) protein n=1 Tax=Pseudomonas sp. NEEL19 TaxID=2867409 RepID=UPI002367D454|nr:Rieske 2Fe-2S domain-containing protein [Pseudomonas sp. NEEL19]WDM59373.1 Rieske 2Fe-2S domain-containing protein [Pseudomonas sp. NEEL19]
MGARRPTSERRLIVLIALFRLEELADGCARGLDPSQSGKDTLFALRSGGEVQLYRNSCPHLDVPLQYRKDRYMSADGSKIICYAHGAQFLPKNGLCVYGPCIGERLTAVPWIERGGWMMVDEAALA